MSVNFITPNMVGHSTQSIWRNIPTIKYWNIIEKYIPEDDQGVSGPTTISNCGDMDKARYTEEWKYILALPYEKVTGNNL